MIFICVCAFVGFFNFIFKIKNYLLMFCACVNLVTLYKCCTAPFAPFAYLLMNGMHFVLFIFYLFASLLYNFITFVCIYDLLLLSKHITTNESLKFYYLWGVVYGSVKSSLVVVSQCDKIYYHFLCRKRKKNKLEWSRN